MIARARLGTRFAAAIIVATGVVACGDGEGAQRKAFIEFLQTRIVNKSGVHVPHLTADESAAFGPYAAHWAVIVDFNAHLDQTVAQPMQKAIAGGIPRSLGEVGSRRPDITAMRDGMAAIRTALDKELATADAARTALKQPDDLKAIYDAAYDRDVAQPAKVWIEIFPDVDAAFASILALADFLDRHKDSIAVDGIMIRTKDPSLQAPLQALLDAMRAHTEAIAKAQQS